MTVLPANTQRHRIVFPATSTNDVQLIVTNGICSDKANNIVTMDNEVKAVFEIPAENSDREIRL